MSILSSIGTGLLDVTSSALIESFNGPRRERIEVIDKEIARLQKERHDLEAELIKTDS